MQNLKYMENKLMNIYCPFKLVLKDFLKHYNKITEYLRFLLM